MKWKPWVFLPALGLLAVTSIPCSVARASSFEGSTCSKIGSEQTYKGFVYKCQLLKGKRSWVVKKPQAEPPSAHMPAQQSPSAAATPSASPVSGPPSAIDTNQAQKQSTTTIAIPTIPTTFENLSENLSGIIYGSWLKASQQIGRSTYDSANLHFLIGPDTQLNEEDAHYQTAINSVSRLYANQKQAQNVYIIYYGSTDIAWAQAEFDKYMDTSYGYGNRETAAIDNCPQPDCSGGMTVHTANFDSIILMGDDNGWKNNNENPNQGYLGHVFAHEYTHTIQQANMNPNWGGIPSWLREGMAEWSAGVAINFQTYVDYLRFRNNQDLGMQYESPGIYNETYIEKFLNPAQAFAPGENIDNYLNSYPHWDSYSLGMMTCEALVSIKGPDSLVNIFKLVNSGASFGAAFANEYGVPWSQAAPQIAKALALEISGNIKK